ncbi:DUF6002 family protein [Micromonospora sp. WMMD882]|uniref:DUF6002 family protein n=1 Tax=Micromonospora sp. WMMD882 TaxID=3015151 RepID=UPI00248B5157|nr:DUF6002 family protein [Micromonospora sp. WMMD882]WBB78077.1 DUF6002 family protein [Micromonospora sp. WMMD882]
MVPLSPLEPATVGVVEAPLVEFDEGVRAAAALVRAERGDDGPDVPLDPPAPDAALAEFYAAGAVAFRAGGRYRDLQWHLLDLMGNPWTRTTKTGPSLLMVARLVAHLRRTGERIMIVTPTSGNKGTALRDAVGRALDLGLVTDEHLRIVTVVPRPSLGKLRHSRLAATPARCRRNPIVVQDTDRGDVVKRLVAELVETTGDEVYRRTGFRLWNSLDLDNYRIADATRAYVEQVCSPPPAAGGRRTHLHSVSSAFGLLGYELGHRVLTDGGCAPNAHRPWSHPAYFLVQQLATPDMVLSLRKGTFDRDALPAYRLDPDGLYRQDGDPAFPAVTHHPDESVDPTFYTRRPATAAGFGELVARHGGGGIVVSLHECLTAYPRVRQMLATVDVELPTDPRELREWSLVKAFTGLMLAVDRGLLDDSGEVVVHGSGSYTDASLAPAPAGTLRTAAAPTELAAHVRAAAEA